MERRGVDQGDSQKERAALVKERKGSEVSWWETSTVLGRCCKGERSQRGKGTRRRAEVFK